MRFSRPGDAQLLLDLVGLSKTEAQRRHRDRATCGGRAELEEVAPGDLRQRLISDGSGRRWATSYFRGPARSTARAAGARYPWARARSERSSSTSGLRSRSRRRGSYGTISPVIPVEPYASIVSFHPARLAGAGTRVHTSTPPPRPSRLRTASTRAIAAATSWGVPPGLSRPSPTP